MRSEFHELAVVTGFFFGPDRLHRFDTFAQDFPATIKRETVFHFLFIPAPANAEQEAAVGIVIERRDLLCERNGMVFDDKADAGAEFKFFRNGSGHRERHERIAHIIVRLWQVAAAGERGLSTRGDMRVFADPK